MLQPRSVVIKGVSLSLLGLSAPIALSPTQGIVTNDACAQGYKCCPITVLVYCDGTPHRWKADVFPPCPKF